MEFSIVFFEQAKFDVHEAKIWYKQQKPGLEKRFAKVIKTSIITIQKNPFIYAIQYQNVRIAHSALFPYGIHFYIDAIKSEIVIIAILHHKRNPAITHKRS
ncbi:type II toxin-antitoxin system RelE/ParE family toxin [Dyadobacter sp. CY356]|uniref:type II toxin-antitoxin system RelE/ParE family toxin n=1 Tax=Dyadobacter sp. CY356 TaxID=2906442 RepID=UPI001F419132|nr:type II toxin-antitoxin system RelE/ParE family toxin [Dyadobacter sp. CY356]MCF0056406.1 type II toxin-antitoxin system RelE/ParE family toxin [Dyadobacter sp. CY356]